VHAKAQKISDRLRLRDFSSFHQIAAEELPRQTRGVLASVFLLCMALGGAIGDPLNGQLFDLFNGYRAMFLMMACYTALAFVVILLVPRGVGEADTGHDAIP